jgi:hypothetical protein
MAAAIFGLVGALLGAVTTLIGSALADRRQARREEGRWRREQRGAAYAETLRYLLRVNRVYGEYPSEWSKIMDQSDWVNDLLDAQYWLRILTMRCRPAQREELSLLALRLDEAIDTLSSDFKMGLTIVIVRACLEGVIKCAHADAGSAGAPNTAMLPDQPARQHIQDDADGDFG